MAPKIFITGITGYIAGDAFYRLQQTHPEYSYTALIRTEEKANKVRSAYPDVRVVIGGLDDSELLTREAAAADIVLHAADASDHEGAAKAIAKGIKEGHSKENPGYWLHTGGTGILTYFDSAADKLGEWEEKEFDDWEGVKEVTTLPDEAFHRNVDKLVLHAGTKDPDVVKTVIVCPPTIYGKGRGPVSGRGRQVYEMTKLILEKGYAPIAGKGKARWTNVHVYDLSDVFVLLVEAAVKKDTNAELWGEKGYIFVENGEHLWADLSRSVAKKAADLGYIEKDPKEQQLKKQEALDVAGFEAVSWGLNSRAKGHRAKKVLGWKPKCHSLEDEVENILKEEKARQG
ncbi:nucleoside-diphosphate-sugar epimerase like protein [Zymoseptoria brevis]|uniref:Nucleoside-diphosphate-sugar epimerase like protein n=1 Tax=Zymoseptoria brevis TaxID=1047168 RepID=A0A0F4H0Q1_9PEZI|nr:nucleoside-diphosphate-sugar epimerase like protein [Zymoseptoria brevis]